MYVIFERMFFFISIMLRRIYTFLKKGALLMGHLQHSSFCCRLVNQIPESLVVKAAILVGLFQYRHSWVSSTIQLMDVALCIGETLSCWMVLEEYLLLLTWIKTVGTDILTGNKTLLHENLQMFYGN